MKNIFKYRNKILHQKNIIPLFATKLRNGISHKQVYNPNFISANCFSAERNILEEKNITQEQFNEQINQLNEPIDEIREGDLFSENGIGQKNAPISWREEKCKIIERKLKENPVLMIKGTRATGKSAMGDAYREYIKKQGKKHYYLNVDTIKTMEYLKKSISEEIKIKNGRKLEEIDMEKPVNEILDEIKYEDCCFVIDETQKIYNDKTFKEFWAYIKTFIDQYRNKPTSKLKFLFLSNYVSDIKKDPVTHQNTRDITPLSLRQLSLPITFLYCTANEMDQINERFNRKIKKFYPELNISKDIKEYIFKQSGGKLGAHIGIIHHYYESIYYHFRRKGKPTGINDRQILDYLRSSDFTIDLMKYRGFIDYKDLLKDGINEKKMRKILVELFYSIEGIISTRSEIYDEMIFKELTAMGIIISEDEKYYTWAFPFQKTLMLQYIFHSDKKNAKQWESGQLEVFIKESLKYLDGRTIARNLSNTIDEGVHLVERPIQRMIGIGFDSLLLPPPTHSIHYEISSHTEFSKDNFLILKDGFLDFFINNKLGWAIELLVENKKPGAHLFQFENSAVDSNGNLQETGKYSSDIGFKINHTIVINFLLKKAPNMNNDGWMDELPKGMWNVIISNDFKKATVIPWNKDGKRSDGKCVWPVLNEETKKEFNVKGYCDTPYSIDLFG